MLDLKSLVPWGQKSNDLSVGNQDRRDPFASFRHEIDRVFDDFFNTGFGVGNRGQSDGFGALTPQLDVKETDKEIVVTAELAGVDEKDIDVTLSGDLLTIKGEKKSEQEEGDKDRRYVERRYGSFARSLRLPFEAGDQAVDANMKNGVLTLTIQKPAEIQQKAKRIEIKAA